MMMIDLSRRRWKKQDQAECCNVIGHGELTVKLNTKIVDNSWKRNRRVQQSQRLHRDLVELLTRTQPDNLCLVFVQLQTIAGHPVSNLRDALRQTIHRIRVYNNNWRVDVDLYVVDVGVTCEPTLSDNIEQLSRIQQEQQRA